MAKKNKKSKSSKGAKRMENYSKRILSVLRKYPDKALNYKQIASRLGIEDQEERNQIIKNLDKLSDKSKIDPAGKGKYKIAGSSDYFEGYLDMTASGNGYVIVKDLDQDIFIPHKKLNHALDGDLVQVFLQTRIKKNKLEGEIVAVLERKTSVFVGILHLKATFGFVEVKNPKMYTDIFVPPTEIQNAKDGEVVKVELNKWPDKEDSPEGKVIGVLGEPAKHETEIQSILAESGLASDFPEE